MSLQSVLSAVRSLWGIAIQRHRTAPKAVQRLQCGHPVKVYDLTLCDHNAYYANGILVSNCGKSPDLYDTYAIGLEGARRLGFVIDNKMPRIVGRNDRNDWRRKLREKAKEEWVAGALDYAA